MQEITGNHGNNAIRRNIVGEGGPIKLHTSVVYFELILGESGTYQWAPPENHSGLVYIVEGSSTVNDKLLQAGDAYRLEQSTQLSFQSEEGSRLMVVFGNPHGEPILQHGTYVD